MLGKIETKRESEPFLIPQAEEIVKPSARREWLLPQAPACKCCGNKNIKYSGKKEGYKFWRCDDCEFVFAEIKQLERDTSRLKRPEKKARTIEFLSPALTWLPPRKLNILDFGCGESNIAKRLRTGGHSVTEVDIVPPKKPHRDRITGDILKLDIPKHSYDLVYSYAVFEYIANPVPILSRLCQLLSENGLLLIHTDMEAADKANDDLEIINSSNRCSFYSYRTFEKMLNKLEYNIIYKNPSMIIARQDL